MATIFDPPLATLGFGNEPNESLQFFGPFASFGYGEEYEIGEFNPNDGLAAADYYLLQMNFMGGGPDG